MKSTRRHFLPTSFSLVLGACLGFFACSQGPVTSGGGGGSDITPRCQDIYIVGDPCDPCLHEKCCSLLPACDAVCLDCLRGALPCNETANEIFRCADKLCDIECGGGPLTTSTGTGGAGGAGGK